MTVILSFVKRDMRACKISTVSNNSKKRIIKIAAFAIAARSRWRCAADTIEMPQHALFAIVHYNEAFDEKIADAMIDFPR